MTAEDTAPTHPRGPRPGILGGIGASADALGPDFERPQQRRQLMLSDWLAVPIFRPRAILALDECGQDFAAEQNAARLAREQLAQIGEQHCAGGVRIVSALAREAHG